MIFLSYFYHKGTTGPFENPGTQEKSPHPSPLSSGLFTIIFPFNPKVTLNKSPPGRILDAGLLKLLKVIMKIEYAKEKSRNSPQNLDCDSEDGSAVQSENHSIGFVYPKHVTVDSSLPWSADGEILLSNNVLILRKENL